MSTFIRAIALSCTVTALAACGGDTENLAEEIDQITTNDPADPRARELAEQFKREMDLQLNLLTRVEIAGDHNFAFFEPEPGMSITLEEGVQGDEASSIAEEMAGLSFAEIYQRLRPGEEVPAALLDADSRREALRPEI